MKINLLKKFYAFLPLGRAFIVTLMLFSVSTNAQIVYTDVNPDVTYNNNGGVYALDLNNDGIIDFDITFYEVQIPNAINKFIRINPLGSNAVGNDLNSYPSALSLNTLIDSSSFQWLGSANQHLISRLLFIPPPTPPQPAFWILKGNWNGASNKYIPLQLDLSSQKIYGWLRLDAATDAASFTVKDYAYNSIPKQSILAGEIITNGIIENPLASSINIYPNPASNHLTITLCSKNKNVEVTITDIFSKIIYSTTSTETEKIEVNTNEFATGIYVVKVQATGFIETKKLFLEK